MKDTIVMSGEDYDKVVQQARADALREAAGIVAKHFERAEKTGDEEWWEYGIDIEKSILSLIDQPQEDVCKWVPRTEYTWDAGCGTRHNRSVTPFCPYCGRPIKVKE